jgi:hypothetical protein
LGTWEQSLRANADKALPVPKALGTKNQEVGSNRLKALMGKELCRSRACSQTLGTPKSIVTIFELIDFG